MTDNNVTGYVNPSPQSYHNGNIASLVGWTYGNGTAINDRVNSVRTRTSSTIYVGVCFYRDPGPAVPQTFIRWSQPGWYDNSSVGLSAAWVVGAACV